jgi:S-adenosylmethionine uptake transporter
MALSPNMLGAAFMTMSMAAFTVNDAFFKLLGADLPFFQILFLRSLAATAILALLAARAGAFRMKLKARDRWLIGIRTLAEICAAYFFLTALVNMEIANVTAILQALPLTVTLGAALFLGEPVGWRRFLAIGIGFVGVYLIVRPGSDGFTIYSLYAITAVISVTIRDLAARRLSPEVPSLRVAAATALGVLCFAGIGAAGTDWQPMAGVHWAWLLGSVTMILGAYTLSVTAMRAGEIGFVAPFRYASLVVALILGLLVFGDWPDGLTLAGAGIVVATGLFTLWRERRARPDVTPFRAR